MLRTARHRQQNRFYAVVAYANDARYLPLPLAPTALAAFAAPAASPPAPPFAASAAASLAAASAADAGLTGNSSVSVRLVCTIVPAASFVAED